MFRLISGLAFFSLAPLSEMPFLLSGRPFRWSGVLHKVPPTLDFHGPYLPEGEPEVRKVKSMGPGLGQAPRVRAQNVWLQGFSGLPCSDLPKSKPGSVAAFLRQQGGKKEGGRFRTKWDTAAPHTPGPPPAAPGSSAVRRSCAAKLGGRLLTLSLVEKYSFWGDFKHKHTDTEKASCAWAGSCEM